MNHQSPLFIEPQWFFLFFAVMWFGICALLSVLSGWSGLAARFRTAQVRVGERFRFASGSMGASMRFPVNYRSCLFFTVANTGLLLSVFFPFRFLSPPLFIPWSEVESIATQHVWFSELAVVRIRGSSIKIMIRGRVGQAVSKAYEQFLHVPLSNIEAAKIPKAPE
jgi:hypothetical protein